MLSKGGEALQKKRSKRRKGRVDGWPTKGRKRKEQVIQFTEKRTLS